MAAASYETGTDTESFAYSNGGTPSALISLPLRYMHTTVESVQISDVKHTADLLFQSAIALTADHSFSYHTPLVSRKK